MEIEGRSRHCLLPPLRTFNAMSSAGLKYRNTKMQWYGKIKNTRAEGGGQCGKTFDKEISSRRRPQFKFWEQANLWLQLCCKQSSSASAIIVRGICIKNCKWSLKIRATHECPPTQQLKHSHFHSHSHSGCPWSFDWRVILSLAFCYWEPRTMQDNARCYCHRGVSKSRRKARA